MLSFSKESSSTDELMDGDKESQASLLGERRSSVSCESHSDRPNIWRDKKKSKLNQGLILFHIFLVLLYTTIFLVLTWRSSIPVTSLHPISDLRLRYVPREYTDFEISPFAGPPSPGVDKAWHDLLEKTTIRVSAEEMKRANQTSVELPAGGGYMAWLGVYHELHCIKMLRQWNYREHYHPGLEEKDRPHWDIHADHCLDVLRSAAMCHADTTLTTFGWADQAQPMLNTRPIQHKCVEWEELMGSVEHRVVAHEEITALVNPLLQHQ